MLSLKTVKSEENSTCKNLIYICNSKDCIKNECKEFFELHCKDNNTKGQEREKELRDKILKILREQGFDVNFQLKPINDDKDTYRKIQEKSRLEQISKQKCFLYDNVNKVKEFCRDGSEINPYNITLELREVISGTINEIIFRWWNYIWWSIPYQRPYGRQMRFILWDKAHDSPFGLISLQSPVLKMAVRDKALGIKKEELDFWINKSMYAQRVGALPPYNELIGGKMVALSLVSNEIREAYKRKYKDYITIIQGRKLDSDLLFITTTSAFGKSSLYNRLKYNGRAVAESLGYTQGSGSFHIPDDIYEEIIEYLSSKGLNTARGYGHGPSRKLKLLSKGFRYLGLPSFEYHGIKREFFLFSFVENLRSVIQEKADPIWINRPFEEMVEYWKERWAIQRAKNTFDWRNFRAEKFFREVSHMLEEL